MSKRILLLSMAMATLAACAPTLGPQQQAAEPVVQHAQASCTVGYVAAAGEQEWTVEGFGGRGERQLMATMRQHPGRCVAVSSDAVADAAAQASASEGATSKVAGLR